MFPEIVIGNFKIDWFSLINFIGIFILIIFALWINKKDDYPFIRKFSYIFIPIYIIVLSFVGFAGGGYLAWIEIQLTSKHIPINYIYSNSDILSGIYGYDWYGGFLLIFILSSFFAFVFIKKKEFLFTFLNYHALVTSLSYALGRQACFISADGCYGIPTNNFLGMRFMYGVKPTFLPVYPTPLIESVIHIFIFAILLKIRKSKSFMPLSAFLILSGSSRFIIEFIRRNPKIFLDLTLAQLISIILIGFGSILFLVSIKSSKNYNYEKN